MFVCETGHRPAKHGTLEYDVDRSQWTSSHPDPRIQKMLECYVQTYLQRRILLPALPTSILERKSMTQSEDLALPRPVRDSQSEMAEIVLPNDSNVLGALLGGRLMHWIDLAGAMAAHRHSRNYVVTASIDHLDFKVPVHVGDLVILRSSVNRVYRDLDGSRSESLGGKLSCLIIVST